MAGHEETTTDENNARYWDYANCSGTSGTASTFNYTSNGTSSTTDFYQMYQRFIVTHHPFVTEEQRARLTQIVNDETTTLGYIELWIHGDVDVVDPSINIRKWVDFLPLLRKVANKQDWELLQDFLGTITP